MIVIQLYIRDCMCAVASSHWSLLGGLTIMFIVPDAHADLSKFVGRVLPSWRRLFLHTAAAVFVWWVVVGLLWQLD